MRVHVRLLISPLWPPELTLVSSKHMDKHTRPYSCQVPQCHGRDFGDKAGLQRHEKEKHGIAKFCCPVLACSRSARGFGRKRNLDLHIASKHRVQVTGAGPMTDRTTNEEASMGFASRENSEMEESGTKIVADLGLLVAPPGVESLRATLRELEAKKTELAEGQAKVDAVIDSLKRTMQLVMKN
ncbi:hypothetical protein NA56DRAFT_302231 [Hyaloscypha hepaticicola]|uniref:C2H2-type domain-containing protein n=1 Tax=Hyaloscypha hepaticicola TaxID=2082293 RepID=A0A2J6PRW2_9HELO|nr:hypothetical protein NA56DRAFT_302231 [Hyaloscypha hepaticicola]